MQGQAIIAGTLALMSVTLIILALSMGFGVDKSQAISQAAPLILVSGVAVALTALLKRQELA